jgi:hypothetical protein
LGKRVCPGKEAPKIELPKGCWSWTDLYFIAQQSFALVIYIAIGAQLSLTFHASHKCSLRFAAPHYRSLLVAALLFATYRCAQLTSYRTIVLVLFTICSLSRCAPCSHILFLLRTSCCAYSLRSLIARSLFAALISSLCARFALVYSLRSYIVLARSHCRADDSLRSLSHSSARSL